ncbi:MAG: SusC/RagA family TonB-linked outer membrane protein [Bacteroidota bacterium]
MRKVYLKATMLMVAFTLLSFTNLIAQNISGVVNDENGEPLPGASVLVVGTTNGTTTDFDGNYSIDVTDDQVQDGQFTLSASFMGYKESTITLSSGSDQVWSPSLEPDAAVLEDVVVVGYGVQKKEDKTGAVASIKASELNTGVLTDPIQGLQGKTPGVQISKKGGDPNGGFSIKIRGSSGFGSNTDPLYVIDGVPGADPTSIAPEDIESFNVLKDASSAAIYGSRGANGVILIETKKGNKDGVTTVDFNTYNSMDVVAKRFDLLSASELREYASDTGKNFSDGGADTDWQDEVFRTGHSQSYNLAFSGGAEDFNYRASISHLDFKGVINGSSKSRDIARINMTQKSLDNRLTLSGNLSATIEHNNYVKYDGNGFQDVIFQMIQHNPTDPIYNEDGSYNRSDRFNYSNPVALIDDIQNERDAKRINGNFKADFEIIEGLKAGVNMGYVRNDHESFFFVPSYSEATTTGGEGKREYDNFESKLIESTLSYNNSFSNVHNLNAVVGYSFQEDTKTGFKASGTGPMSDYVESNNLEALSIVGLGGITSFKEENRLISFFGRAAYNYNSKYYVTATLRRDGSSRFGTNKKWGIFPSGSVGWVLSKEDFLSDSEFIDQLKLRAGYGYTGNQEIGNYLSVPYVGIQGTAIDPETGKPIPVFGLTNNANPNLQWESNAELNIGLDFAFLNSRISGSIEYYNKRTYDLLGEYRVPVPPYKHQYIWYNGGEVNNTGIELFLEAFVIDNENLNWKTSFSFSANRQEIIALGDEKFNLDFKETGWIQGPGMVGVASQRVAPGMSFGTFYGYKYAGMSTNGEWLFYDKQGKLKNYDELQRMLKQGDDQRQVLGSALPDFEIGWSNYITLYKNFDMNLVFRAVYGAEVLNVTKMIFGNPSILPTNNALTDAKDLTGVLSDPPIYSDYYIEDGSFIRLENISLGYNFDTDNVNWLRKARLYFNVNNVFVLSGYSGIDPEMDYGDNDNKGIDQYNVYPKTRSFTLGLNVGF